MKGYRVRGFMGFLRLRVFKVRVPLFREKYHMFSELHLDCFVGRLPLKPKTREPERNILSLH